MGALAITVLAGARIVEMADAPMVAATRDLIAGLAVVFWAFATWLIPVLVAAGWWRHVVRRVPLRYDATLWSIVFPLGMYAVAGIYLGRADDLPVVGRDRPRRAVAGLHRLPAAAGGDGRPPGPDRRHRRLARPDPSMRGAKAIPTLVEVRGRAAPEPRDPVRQPRTPHPFETKFELFFE